MKVAILGAGGLRTPLLLRGLDSCRLPIEQIALYDIDSERLQWMKRIAQESGVSVFLSACTRVEDAVRDTRFVFASVRVGGIESRGWDESVCRERGLVAQETVGPAGFALGYRNIPPMIDYARRVAAEAPQAYLINFTNPVGMVTQAMACETEARVIGICDTPTELFAAVAEVLGLDPLSAEYDYFGLNHLGWLRQVRSAGTDHLARLWENPHLLDGIYRARLFTHEELAGRRLLPSEYLFYYYHSQAAIDNVLRAGSSRGEALSRSNARFFETLVQSKNPSELYLNYLGRRQASYFQLESGGATLTNVPESRWTGYDRIAVAVAEALWLDENIRLPVNVPNGDTISGLNPDDVVEVMCRVGAHGAEPVELSAPPDTVAPLIFRVKRYERETIRASLSRKTDDVVSALTMNPLVPNVEIAETLAQSLRLTNSDKEHPSC